MATKNFATFKLGDQLFGLDILFVREINKQLEFTAVQKAPDYVQGLVNLRGQIVTVLNLNKRLGEPSSMQANTSTDSGKKRGYNIVLKSDAELASLRARAEQIYGAGADDEIPIGLDNVGLMVDEIGDVISVESDEIAPAPPNIGDLDGKFLSGVVTLEKQLLAIVNLSHVLTNTAA